MADSVGFAQKWNTFMDKVRPGAQKVGHAFRTVWHVLSAIGTWIYRLRGAFMAVPVIYATLKLAMYNMQNLPEQVGLNLLSTGEFAHTVARGLAVYGPVGITAGCLVLMCFSRRPLYPWVISIFTLVLPLLILMTNNLDALLVLLKLQ